MHRAAASRTALSIAKNSGGRRAFADVATAPKPKPKRRVLPRLLVGAVAGGAAFYAGSTALALTSEPYRDFFVEAVPGAERILAEAERLGWDGLALSKKGKESVDRAKEEARARAQEQLQQRAAAARERVQEAKAKGKGVVETLATKVERGAAKTDEKAHQAKDTVKAAAVSVKGKVEHAAAAVTDDLKHAAADPAAAFSDGVHELVKLVEEALNGASEPTTPPAPAPEPVQPANVYQGKLPIGFEPPPGYIAPKAAKVSAPSTPATPSPSTPASLSEVSSSDPQVARLAATIATLTRIAQENPSAAAGVQDALSNARAALAAIAARLDAVPAEVHAQLEKREKAHTRAVLELEMGAQARFDEQEDLWRAAFEAERRKLADAYKAKLQAELDAHTALIEERLKQEVVAQGIELQRRWIREVKVRVEQERAGRLAKLDELAAEVKRLDATAADNAAYLDENLRIHKVASAVRALAGVLARPQRTPFRTELRALASSAGGDDAIAAALAALDASDIPDVGVDPLPDLAAWFAEGVEPDVRRVALVPERGGVLAHAASAVLSNAAFARRGLVEGGDALSVLARAAYHVEREDLDSACRELNQLEGSARQVAAEWLDAARRRLQVQQALEVVQTAATLDSLMVV